MGVAFSFAFVFYVVLWPYALRLLLPFSGLGSKSSEKIHFESYIIYLQIVKKMILSILKKKTKII